MVGTKEVKDLIKTASDNIHSWKTSTYDIYLLSLNWIWFIDITVEEGEENTKKQSQEKKGSKTYS